MNGRKTSRPKVEKLELNKETVQDLTESEAATAEGGQVYRPGASAGCSYQCDSGWHLCRGWSHEGGQCITVGNNATCKGGGGCAVAR